LTTFDTLTIEEFIPMADVPWERAQASYYLAPASKVGSNVLRMLVTLREAMEQEKVVGVAKLMPKSRQKLAIIYSRHGGLMVTCLAYADTFKQVLDGAASMDGVEVNDEVLGWTRKLIEAKKRGPEALDEYRDDLIDLRADLIERAKLGQPLKPEAEEVPAKVPVTTGSDALLDALRASVKHAQAEKKKAAKPKASRGSTSERKPAKV
jgi:DNA end-binding protein Ku